MDMEKMKRGEEEPTGLTSHVLRHCFHALSLILLSLVLPLSFLLLARLTTMNDLLGSDPAFSSTFFTMSLKAGPFFLRVLIPFTCIATLVSSLTGQYLKAGVMFAWVVLCIFQTCVTLGIDATIIAGFKPVHAENVGRPTWIGKLVFFVGLYETMLTWGRMFVKPVVDDTIFGAPLKEDSNDKIVQGIAFCGLWLCLLQEEVESLVVDAGKTNLSTGSGFGMGMDGVVSWLVGYVTIMVGIVRSMRCLVKVLNYLFSRCKLEENEFFNSTPLDSVV